LSRAALAAAGRPTLAEALLEIAEAARELAAADVALVRVEGGGLLEAVAVAGPSALAAELEGTTLPPGELPQSTLADLAAAPAAVRRTAARAAARSALVVPLDLGGAVGSLELYRSGAQFAPAERVAAELAAAHVVLVQRSFRTAPQDAALPRPALELAGEPLAAAEVVRVAANVVGAPVGLLWEDDGGGALRLAASHGLPPDTEVDAARELAQRALDVPGPIHAV